MYRTEDRQTIRKAAVLLASLDAGESATLLEELDDDTATEIRRLAAELADIAPEERDRVLAEFLDSDLTSREATGVEVDDSLARRLAQNQDASSAEPTETAPMYLPWRTLPSPTIGRCLQDEHPQVIAVVLTQLPPAQAAEVLGQLSADLQTDVLRRITRAPHAAPELLSEIVEAIESRLPWIADLRVTPEEGTAAAQAILDAADDQSRRRWMSALSKPVDGPRAASDAPADAERHTHAPAASNPTRLAHEYRKSFAGVPNNAPMLAHDHGGLVAVSVAPANRAEERASWAETSSSSDQLGDLLHWDDDSLAELFRVADPLIVVLALAGAPPSVARQLEARLAPRESRVLTRQVTRLGPWRLNDATRAARQLLQIAHDLQTAHRSTNATAQTKAA